MKIFITLIIFSITNVNADCTPKDLTDPAYLKSMGKENLIEHFKKPRNQDSVGWCVVYSMSDALTFAVGEPVSAMDLSFTHYDKFNYSGKLDIVGQNSVTVYMENLRDVGYCPESVIPSNQTSSSNLGNVSTITILQSFQKIYEDYEAKGKPENYCVDCIKGYEKSIKPSLPGATTDLVQSVLQKNHSSSVKAYKDLMDQLCEGKRVKVYPGYKYIPTINLHGKRISTVLDEALDNNSMPAIGINDANTFSSLGGDSSSPYGNGHSMLVVARRVAANGKCEYLIRNSWGRGCSSYLPQFKAKCDPANGSFWMDQDEVQTRIDDIKVVENEKFRTEVEEKKEVVVKKPSFFDRFKNRPKTKKMLSPWKNFTNAFKY